jgi:hypothetical protein
MRVTGRFSSARSGTEAVADSLGLRDRAEYYAWPCCCAFALHIYLASNRLLCVLGIRRIRGGQNTDLILRKRGLDRKQGTGEWIGRKNFYGQELSDEQAQTTEAAGINPLP